MTLPLFTAIPAYGLREGSTVALWEQSSGNGTPENTLILEEAEDGFRILSYLIQGWAMDSDRLKNGGSVLTQEYFDHLLKQIREIWMSERKFYQKITDIYATALDYDKSARSTRLFFAEIQNKLHRAIHRHYLSKEELQALERIVTMYLDYAEYQAGRHIPMTMQDWSQRLNRFLEFNEHEILHDTGRVTHEIAKSFTEIEFEKYRIVQDQMF